MLNAPEDRSLAVGTGTVINDRYEIVSLLGRGGTSAVYKVRDLRLDGQEIALKLLKSALLEKKDSMRERFRREAIISRKLDHPNIVRVYDFDSTARGDYYITMELIRGRSLASLIHPSKARLPRAELTQIFCEVLDGLESAHKLGIVHRDLKPANVLLNEDGKVKLMDFGLARANCFETSLSATGECIGTPSYMAPEQIRGGEVDARTDIYTLGLLVFEALTGTMPFVADSWFLVAEKHLREPFPLLPAIAAPAAWNELLQKCTQKDPAARFATADEVRRFMATAFAS